MIASYAPVALAEAGDESEFGGKAVQLGAAIRAGLPVPPGVALGAAAAAAVAAGEQAATATVLDLRASLEGPLAVRSSCVGEDSAGASFAGQHQTKLNVKTSQQLAEAVSAVWQSGCCESAIAYRRKLGLDGEPRMGVVVQELIEPEVAGVLFTRHPVTGADECLIEAAWGLGEAVVQGTVTPDLYRVSRAGEVLERTVGHKDRAIRSRPDGSTALKPVAPGSVDALCLDDAALTALHGLAVACEESFDGPSDVEWALAGGAVHLLQCRPITTVPK